MDQLHRYYDDMLRRYGPHDARALAWRDQSSQQARFQVLSEIADLSGASILDEGCGLGDLYEFLNARFTRITYTGVDINERLITAARAKYPEASFEVADFSSYAGQPVDYAFASGTFSFRVPHYREVYFGQIAKMFSLSRKAIAYNFLNAEEFAGNDLYVTYSLPEMYEFARTLTDKVAVRDDYMAEDFTLYLYK